MRKLSIALLFLALTSASALQSDARHLMNSDVLNKKLLPDVRHLLKEKSDGNRQKFLHLLASLDIEGYKFVSDAPFTIVVPKLTFDAASADNATLQQLVLEHIVPGVQLKALRNGEVYGNMNHNAIEVKSLTPNRWQINDVNVLEFNWLSAKLISFVEIDGYLNDRKNTFAKRNIQEHNSYNEPQKLVQKEVNKSDVLAKEPKTGLLLNYLSTMKSGTKVFHHFLKGSNLTSILEDTTDNFIILVPSDTAFQRWHPIDWGFYPFSVPEFTETIMRNHVIQQKQPFDLKSIEKELKMKTLGGEFVVFRNLPTPSVNNVSIVSNATLSNGNDVYVISEVLFMTDSKVSKLHQQNKDKETPPLLAFPWFGSQFLSHSFLALERDNRFTQIVRFLSTADIASSIVGSNYTFFVPQDDAFEKYGFDELSEDILISNRTVTFILNHFVKGRLYNRDLIDGETFESVGGSTIRISKDLAGHTAVNDARIVESEVFVYNLGTMYYIDDILHPEVLQNDYRPNTQSPKPNRREDSEDSSEEESYTTETPVFEDGEKLTTKTNREPTTSEYRSVMQALLTTRADVEFVASDFTEFTAEDFSSSDSFITPQALPSRLVASPPK